VTNHPKAGRTRKEPHLKRVAGDRGFTLPEVLIAMVIVTVAVVSFMSLFVYGSRWTAESRRLLTAVNLAQGKLEELKNTPFENITNQPADPDAPALDFPGFPEYTYRISVTLAGQKLKTVSVAVYYEDITGKKVLTFAMDKRKG